MKSKQKIPSIGMIDKIKVKNLLAQLQSCDGFEVNRESPMLDGLAWEAEVKGEPNNQIALISWCDEDAQEYSIILTERGLSDAQVSGQCINCYDIEDNPVDITLWRRVAWPTEKLMEHGANLDTTALDKI